MDRANAGLNRCRPGVGPRCAQCESTRPRNALAANRHWLCLACGHVACSFDGYTTKAFVAPLPPEGHTRAHSASNRRHALAVSLEAAPHVFCAACNRDVTAAARTHPDLAAILDAIHTASARWDAPPSSATATATSTKMAAMTAAGKGKGKGMGKGKNAYKGTGTVKSTGKSRGAGKNVTGAGGGGRAFPGVRGLRNLGNSCFLNALLQGLAHTPRVVAALTDPAAALRAGPATDALVAALRGVLEPDTTRGPYSPGDLLDALAAYAPRFRTRRSQDAHEALAALLDLVDREQRPPAAAPAAAPASGSHTVVDTLFQGCAVQTIRCRACGYESTTRQPFLCLPLAFPQQYLPRTPVPPAPAPVPKPQAQAPAKAAEPERITAPDSASVAPLPDLRGVARESVAAAGGGGTSGECSVEALLRCFTEPHAMCGEERYQCPACTLRRAGRAWTGDAGDVALGALPRVYANATQQCVLAQLPRVLVLQLVRFHAVGTRLARVAVPVAVPTVLDVRPYACAGSVTGATRYRLTGVAEHRGALSHGHYTATVAHPDAAHWYHCSDTTVIAVEPPGRALTSTNAYILFYQREDTPLPPPPPPLPVTTEQVHEEEQDKPKKEEEEKKEEKPQGEEERKPE